jgi:hypothetical protein
MGFRPLPHAKHETGGMVFPQEQIDEIRRPSSATWSGSTSSSTCPTI